MTFLASRTARIMTAAAAFAMTASPVLARDWNGGWGGRRHHDRVDAGDVIAGVLIIGGIAAIASAASKSKKQREGQDYRYPDGGTYREESGGYGSGSDDRSTQGYRSSGLNAAVDRCVGEVERGDRSVDTVDSVDRDGTGWRVEGRTSNGRDFACTIDGEGRIRSVTVDGTAA